MHRQAAEDSGNQVLQHAARLQTRQSVPPLQLMRKVIGLIVTIDVRPRFFLERMLGWLHAKQPMIFANGREPEALSSIPALCVRLDKWQRSGGHPRQLSVRFASVS